MLESHEAQISPMRVISLVGFSAISHVQASMPAEIADGVNTANGNATR
jgi:hypothetical protein